MVMERRQWEMTLSRFQACVRGYLMRKEINSAREDFQDIVREIDGNLDHLQWRDGIIPVPHFTDTDGLFLPSKPLKPGHDIVLRSFYQLPALPSEKRGVHSPEKLEAERDVSSSQISLSRECSSSIPAGGGDGEGETGSGQGDEVKDGERGAIECTGDTTTVWSSLGLDVGHSHSHLGAQQYCLAQEVPYTPEALRLHRNTLAMELLWLQQAIGSRKKYLSVKERLGIP